MEVNCAVAGPEYSQSPSKLDVTGPGVALQRKMKRFSMRRDEMAKQTTLYILQEKDNQRVVNGNLPQRNRGSHFPFRTCIEGSNFGSKVDLIHCQTCMLACMLHVCEVS